MIENKDNQEKYLQDKINKNNTITNNKYSRKNKTATNE